MRSPALVTALLLGAGMLAPAVAQAQSPKRPSVEFALLSSVNYVIQYRGYLIAYDNWDDPPTVLYDRGLEDHYTAITCPSISPGVRLTDWSLRPLLIDFAMSWMQVRGFDGYMHDALMLEFGVGRDLAEREGTEHPFVGILCGLSVIQPSDLTPYLGAQLGLRHFIRDYAALRAQVGYRATINRHDANLRSIEIAAGIGFFL